MGREPIIKPAMAIAGELNAELVRSRKVILIHSSFDLLVRLTLLAARAPTLAALYWQIMPQRATAGCHRSVGLITPQHRCSVVFTPAAGALTRRYHRTDTLRNLAIGKA